MKNGFMVELLCCLSYSFSALWFEVRTVHFVFIIFLGPGENIDIQTCVVESN